MSEEDRTGDPAADAPPPGRGAWRGNIGCIAAAIIVAVIIALIYAINYGAR